MGIKCKELYAERAPAKRNFFLYLLNFFQSFSDIWTVRELMASVTM